MRTAMALSNKVGYKMGFKNKFLNNKDNLSSDDTMQHSQL